MAKACMLNGSSGTSVAASAQRFFVAANAAPSAETTQLNSQITWETAGTFSNLYLRVETHSDPGGFASATFSFQINGADGNQVIIVPVAVTGEFEDTDSDVVADGDEVNYSMIAGSGVISFTIAGILFESSTATDTVVRHAATGFPDLSDGSTYYAALTDSCPGIFTAEARSKIGLNATGTARKLQANISSNLGIAGATITLMKNGVGTAQIAPTLAQTGIILDNEDVSFTAGDYADYKIATLVGLALVIEIISVEYKTTTNKFHSIFGATGAAFVNSFNAKRFVPVGGGSATMESTELRTKSDVNVKATASNLLVNVLENTLAY